MTNYIVTITPPFYISVSAPDEETAKAMALEDWFAERLDLSIDNVVDRTDWYFGGDVDIWDSDDVDVSIDESQ